MKGDVEANVLTDRCCFRGRPSRRPGGPQGPPREKAPPTRGLPEPRARSLTALESKHQGETRPGTRVPDPATG